MLYLVEIRREHADLGTVMASIRQWLDEHRFEPNSFRYTKDDAGVTFRIEFKYEAEAAACADSFGGQVSRVG
jgi:hypothetical protein